MPRIGGHWWCGGHRSAVNHWIEGAKTKNDAAAALIRSAASRWPFPAQDRPTVEHALRIERERSQEVSEALRLFVVEKRFPAMDPVLTWLVATRISWVYQVLLIYEQAPSPVSIVGGDLWSWIVWRTWDTIGRAQWGVDMETLAVAFEAGLRAGLDGAFSA